MDLLLLSLGFMINLLECFQHSEQTLLCQKAGGEAAGSVVIIETLPDFMKDRLLFIKENFLQGLLYTYYVLVPADQCCCCPD